MHSMSVQKEGSHYLNINPLPQNESSKKTLLVDAKLFENKINQNSSNIALEENLAIRARKISNNYDLTTLNAAFQLLMKEKPNYLEQPDVIDKWIYNFLKVIVTGNVEQLRDNLNILKSAHHENQAVIVAVAFSLAQSKGRTDCCAELIKFNASLNIELPLPLGFYRAKETQTNFVDLLIRESRSSASQKNEMRAKKISEFLFGLGVFTLVAIIAPDDKIPYVVATGLISLGALWLTAERRTDNSFEHSKRLEFIGRMIKTEGFNSEIISRHFLSMFKWLAS